jgi:hypothetical protein
MSVYQSLDPVNQSQKARDLIHILRHPGEVISCSSVIWGIDTEVLLSTRRLFVSLELDSLVGIGNLLSLGLRPTDGGIINRFSFGFFRGLFRCTLRRLVRRLG